jgi:dimethylargininase
MPVDLELAAAQWGAYVAAFVSAGWHAIEVPPADDCPDSVFVEDTAVVYRSVAVVCRPGADTRRPEVEGVAPVLESLGYSTDRIRAPGTLDGGDVMKVGDTIYVGESGRTNADGVRQLRAILGPVGATSSRFRSPRCSISRPPSPPYPTDRSSATRPP